MILKVKNIDLDCSFDNLALFAKVHDFIIRAAADYEARPTDWFYGASLDGNSWIEESRYVRFVMSEIKNSLAAIGLISCMRTIALQENGFSYRKDMPSGAELKESFASFLFNFAINHGDPFEEYVEKDESC